MMARQLPSPATTLATSTAEGGAEPSTTPGPAPGRVHPDVATGLVIVALCLGVWGLTLAFDDVPAAIATGMSPATFPRLVLGVIIVLACWLALTASNRSQPEIEAVHPMVYATAAAIGGAMAAMAVFGIHGAVVASVIGIGRLWGERRLLLLATIAAGMSLSLHFAFVRGFGIGLPHGLLQTWLS
ncbi:tripartite tricarboxylate transporter TctB family protein [Bosea sp. (in: a-proteobacteria)]|uniref:Tripartite tricarboxylate transporter TctB family protein n=2 Tax=Bosea vestrisii TaxID=151416 RepID=A0ABW0H8B3_9HYPH|nr:tripartite tricarboxylate transporter TctB family protein [Bosea sp. (in: a-proteobacteria)]MBR3189384.1 tripartite tricarboxylate transporter TctB family protein [Bosea sp. (in: a-proteobacteria)]